MIKLNSETEKDSLYNNLEKMSTLEILSSINNEDKKLEEMRNTAFRIVTNETELRKKLDAVNKRYELRKKKLEELSNRKYTDDKKQIFSCKFETFREKAQKLDFWYDEEKTRTKNSEKALFEAKNEMINKIEKLATFNTERSSLQKRRSAVSKNYS